MADDGLRRLIPAAVLWILSGTACAGGLDDFRSDGCSLFPDGTPLRQDLWCECCIAHDVAYWQGGSRRQKETADLALRECVARTTGNEVLAATMYYGVVLGGSPVFPTWYRWGYGWRYGRGFRSLDRYEKQRVREKLQQHRLLSPPSSCDIVNPLETLIEGRIERWRSAGE